MKEKKRDGGERNEICEKRKRNKALVKREAENTERYRASGCGLNARRAARAI